MPQISGALLSARAAIDHPQCGQTLQKAVATVARPFGDSQALAILLAVLHHPGIDAVQKAEADKLLAIWEEKCGHWHLDQLSARNAVPELPARYQSWQPYLTVALNTAGR